MIAKTGNRFSRRRSGAGEAHPPAARNCLNLKVVDFAVQAAVLPIRQAAAMATPARFSLYFPAIRDHRPSRVRGNWATPRKIVAVGGRRRRRVRGSRRGCNLGLRALANYLKVQSDPPGLRPQSGAVVSAR
jgi:hypothetical protein